MFIGIDFVSTTVYKDSRLESGYENVPTDDILMTQVWRNNGQSFLKNTSPL